MTNSPAGCYLVHAHRSGLLTPNQLRDNLSLLIAGHENPQLFLYSLLHWWWGG